MLNIIFFNLVVKCKTNNVSIYILSVCSEKNSDLLKKNYFCTPISFSMWGGVYEGSLLLAVLRTSIHARGISDITIGQRRNVCYCQLELGLVERWNNRLPLAV